MTQDEMIEWFKSAPEGSRHHRMVWTAHKIVRLTGATEGGARARRTKGPGEASILYHTLKCDRPWRLSDNEIIGAG